MSAHATHSGSWAEIELAAIRSNVAVLRRAAGSAAIAAVVKADGYGHGAVPVARAALEAGAAQICVFALHEAVQLRAAGLQAPILLLGPLPPDQADRAAQLGLTVSLRTDAEVEACAQAANAAGRRTPVQLNVDAGMQRLGLTPSDAVALAAAVRAHNSLRLEAVYTHLPDAAGGDPARTRAAFARFMETADAIGAPLRHAAASAAIFRFPETALDLVRPGIALYGEAPFDDAPDYGLRPALAWRARLLAVRDVPAGQPVSYGGLWTARRESRIGVVAVGYADGLPRALWDRAEMLVRGRRAPIAGAICMDLTMIDLTDIPEAAEGDSVTLIGQDASEHISATELAAQAGMLSYEVLTGIAARVPRVYV